MADLDAALASGSLPLLLGTAVGLGFLHSVMGPDHYVPFVMMARAQDWSRSKTMMVTFLCGVGHVGSSAVIGAGLAVAGMALAGWQESRWAAWHESRGSLAAWILMGVGAAFMVWGTVRAARCRRHSHVHAHEDGTIHAHEHNHRGAHMHVHESRVRSVTPWVLFAVFVLGPCESLIPLMLAAWAAAGLGGAVLVVTGFSVATILTIMGAVGLLLLGISRVPFGTLDRWATPVAGLSLVLCGAAIQWLGL
jgi:ABC-type nickel/cobalt efflux system permease component RcnA